MTVREWAESIAANQGKCQRCPEACKGILGCPILRGIDRAEETPLCKATGSYGRECKARVANGSRLGESEIPEI